MATRRNIPAGSTLKKGRVPIRLDYFQWKHGLGLSVAWSGPGFAHRSLSAPKPGEESTGGKGLSRVDLARMIRAEGTRILGETKAQRYRELRRELDGMRNSKVPAERALIVTEAGAEAPETYVLIRGNPTRPRRQGRAGVPPGPRHQGPRLYPRRRLARSRPAGGPSWPTGSPAPRIPLTARVMANRVWQYHFGRGIVRSPRATSAPRATSRPIPSCSTGWPRS